MTPMESIILACAQGAVSIAEVVPSVQAKSTYTYGKRAASFIKIAPGQFEVQLYESGEIVENKKLSSPIAAKLTVLEWVIQAAKNEMAQPAH